MTSSFADGVLAHVASRVAPGVDVVFLDTGLHFAQTLRVRDQVAATHAGAGAVDPAACRRSASRTASTARGCSPATPTRAARCARSSRWSGRWPTYDAWAAGMRRGETAARANVREVDFDASRGKVKVAPLARWTDADVEAYIARYDVPVNALLRQGYGSVGCWPCTRKVQPGEDPRAGRWAMFDKTECGLHR